MIMGLAKLMHKFSKIACTIWRGMGKNTISEYLCVWDHKKEKEQAEKINMKEISRKEKKYGCHLILGKI